MSEYLINQGKFNFSAPVKPRPLVGMPKMEGIDIELDSGGYAERYCGVFDGRHIWISRYSGNLNMLTIVDSQTNQVEYLPIDLKELNLYIVASCFDGKDIWFIPHVESQSLVKFDPASKAFTQYGPQKYGTLQRQVIYDGKHIWTGATNGNVARIDLSTGDVLLVPITDNIEATSYQLSYDGEKLWVVSSDQQITDVAVLSCINTETLEVNYTTTLHIRFHHFGALAHANGALWYIPVLEGVDDTVIKYDIASKEVTRFSVQDGINGNQGLSFAKGQPCPVYDGKYIWIGQNGPGIIRLDASTGTMTGFAYHGKNLGKWTTGAWGFDICFDGRNLWLIPMYGDKLLKIYPDETTFCITEQFHTEDGIPLRQNRFAWADLATTYTGTAPTIDGYTCLGHRIDSGELQSLPTATIPDVEADHTVTFVYRKDDDGSDPGPDPGPDPDPGDNCCNNTTEFEVDACITMKFKLDCTDVKLKDCSPCCAEVNCNSIKIK